VQQQQTEEDCYGQHSKHHLQDCAEMCCFESDYLGNQPEVNVTII
jgi:hypothetical protein